MTAIFANELLELIRTHDVPFWIQGGEITLEGFYKSGGLKLFIRDDGTITATSRYYDEGEITCFNDLVSINYKWWDITRGRGFADLPYDTYWSKYLKERYGEERVQARQ